MRRFHAAACVLSRRAADSAPFASRTSQRVGSRTPWQILDRSAPHTVARASSQTTKVASSEFNNAATGTQNRRNPPDFEADEQIPPPKRPQRMMEVARKPTGIRGLISKLFKNESSAIEKSAQRLRKDRLANIGLNKELKFLNTDHATNVLYWYCIDLSFLHDDFARLLPDPSLRSGSYDAQFDEIPFAMTRARNPVNLTKWMGYFLTFDSKEAAMLYYQETLGAELAGMPLKLRFVDTDIRGLDSPLLSRVPGLSRKSHALVLGLPVGYSPTTLLRALWDYDLLDDDNLAVERLPVDKVKYGGSPFLLRFKTEDEAERFAKDFNREVFPYTDSRVFCEVID